MVLKYKIFEIFKYLIYWFFVYFVIFFFKLGFKNRQFLSKTGEFIFVVIYADDSNLRVTAEKD